MTNREKLREYIRALTDTAMLLLVLDSTDCPDRTVGCNECLIRKFCNEPVDITEDVIKTWLEEEYE